MVWDESANTVKIMRLKSLALYGTSAYTILILCVPVYLAQKLHITLLSLPEGDQFS